MKLIETLNWRYATKRMNGKIVPQEKIDNILAATRLSASSIGLQPYKIIVISNTKIRAELQVAAYNQPQITEASHLLVFAAYSSVTEQHTEDFLQLHSRIKNVPVETLSGLKASLTGNILSRSDEANFNWAARQAYIALGTALIAAANEQVDATPMEGFSPDEFDRILGLNEKGLKSVVLLTLGYRDEANDYLVNLPKVRKDINDLVIKID